MAEEPYRRMTEEEKADKYDYGYDVLIGPRGFECMLGEPEDRNWFRDGRDAIDRLNELEAEVEQLRELWDVMRGIHGVNYLAYLRNEAFQRLGRYDGAISDDCRASFAADYEKLTRICESLATEVSDADDIE